MTKGAIREGYAQAKDGKWEAQENQGIERETDESGVVQDTLVSGSHASLAFFPGFSWLAALQLLSPEQLPLSQDPSWKRTGQVAK